MFFNVELKSGKSDKYDMEWSDAMYSPQREPRSVHRNSNTYDKVKYAVTGAGAAAAASATLYSNNDAYKYAAIAIFAIIGLGFLFGYFGKKY